MRDYSDTICIQYPGGYGGEFFCHLLNTAINKRSRLAVKCNEHSKYTWKNDIYPNELNHAFKCIGKTMREYKREYRKKRKEDNRDWTDILYARNNKSPVLLGVEKVVATLYDDDKKQFMDNYKDFLRFFYKEKPKEVDYQIYCFHYDINEPQLYLNHVFPGCTSYVLHAPIKRHAIYFRILDAYKNFLTRADNEFEEHAAGNVRDYMTSYARPWPPLFPTKVIDMGKFVFEDSEDSTSDLENQMSSIQDTKVSFDRQMIDTYRKKNKKIIDDFLGVEDADEVPENKLLEMAIQSWIDFVK